ncbi:hypothetical protein MKS88_002216 [Plasmodium brasilianum]|uniref:Uncharacterized protein n=1 Tax=Plasmodium brasilianum TaxID=5824 RepID=A0ACB9YB08_PLABR|nr:hypothetical protein MKS88_002216 [Plasmodium brasilianum]
MNFYLIKDIITSNDSNMNGKINYFILCIIDKSLDYINYENRTLNSKNDKLLSESKCKTKNVIFRDTLLRNEYYNSENKEDNLESTGKDNSICSSNKLGKEYASVICKPFISIDNFFEKLLYI